MPGPVTFTINYTCSPNATFGILEYRHLQPDNTWSPWVQNTALGTFAINTSGGLNQTLTGVQGNDAEFNLNTTYQFRILQRCSGNLGDQYSGISDDVYAESCIDFTALLSAQGYVDSSYAIDIYFSNPTMPGGLIDPLASSITSYSFTVFEFANQTLNNIGTVVVDYTDIVLGSDGYKFTITSADLTTALNASGTYSVELQISFITSTGTINVTCPAAEALILPACDTYKIWTGRFWTLTYIDCNGSTVKIYNDINMPSGTVVGTNSFFYVCSQIVPIGGTCLQVPTNGFPAGANPPFYNNPFTGQITPITNPVLAGSWPVSDHVLGAVVEIDPNTEGCPSSFNGKTGLITQNVLVQVPVC